MSAGGGESASEAVERRVRRLMGAYPWRVRLERGDEIVATVLDAHPEACRLSARDQFDLVKGGLAMRWQRRPPARVVLAYSLGFRVHPRWLPWVADDLDDLNYVRRERAKILVGLLALGLAAAIATGSELPLVSFGLQGALIAWRVPRFRERARARYALGPGGPAPDRSWVEHSVAPAFPNLRAAAVLTATGGATVVGLGACLLAAAHRSPDSAPAGLARYLAVTVHSADTVASLGLLTIGMAVALCLWGAAAWLRGRRPVSPDAAVDTRLSIAVGSVLSLVVMAVCIPLAAVIRWQWVSERYIQVVAVLLGAALVSTLVGIAMSLRGWKRGRPFGLWELVPRLGPRTVWTVTSIVAPGRVAGRGPIQ